jgi:hypothetical protein
MLCLNFFSTSTKYFIQHYKCFIVCSFISNIIIFKCNAELYTALHKDEINDKYHCSTSSFLAYTIDDLCNPRNIDLASKKYTHLVQLKNHGNSLFCSASPYLSQTQKEICHSYSIQEDIKNRQEEKHKTSEELGKKLHDLHDMIGAKINNSVVEKLQSTKERFISNEIDLIPDYSNNPCYQQKSNFVQLKVILTKYDYYNNILEDYAKYIENIKPFSAEKALTYINYINRSIYPNSLKLAFSNCSEKNMLVQHATLSLNLKKLSANIDLNSGKQAFMMLNDEEQYSNSAYFTMRYNDLWLKNSSLNYELRGYNDNYKHKIKYSKLFNISATQFINTSISFNNFDYMADVYTLDNFSNLTNNILGIDNNHSSNNFILDANYTTLRASDIEYTIGYMHRYAKYRYKSDSYKNHGYNVNNVYAITRFHKLGISLYLDNEFSFNKKYRNTIAAILYKRSFKDCFFNALLMYGDRNINAEYRARYYNNEFIASKKINISSRTLKQIKPYIGLRYMDIRGDNKKDSTKIVSMNNNKLQKIIGIDIKLCCINIDRMYHSVF